MGDGDGRITWEGDVQTGQDALTYCDGLVFAWFVCFWNGVGAYFDADLGIHICVRAVRGGP
ncbi:MAG: hypothetical protein JXP34_16125 [Planctomycetes bacterium]|nr:hypothetical protein [Planctomycetota bacterium]